MMGPIVILTHHRVPNREVVPQGGAKPWNFRGLCREPARARQFGGFALESPPDSELESGFVVTTAVHD
jgi:hypothetical protein